MSIDLNGRVKANNIKQRIGSDLDERVKAWYRKHGNECEFSVWRVIKLVRIYVGLEGTTNVKLISDAEMLAPIVLR